MPCTNEEHTHAAWPTQGLLTIQRCENVCAFCGKHNKFAWYNRRHVEQVHTKQFPNLVVSEDWLDKDGKPTSNAKAGTKDKKKAERKEKKTKQRQTKKTATTPPPQPQAQQCLPNNFDFASFPTVHQTHSPESMGCGSDTSSMATTVSMAQLSLTPPQEQVNFFDNLPPPQEQFNLFDDFPPYGSGLPGALDPALAFGEENVGDWTTAAMLRDSLDMSSSSNLTSPSIDPGLLSGGSSDIMPWSSPQKGRCDTTIIDSAKPDFDKAYGSNVIIDGLNLILTQPPDGVSQNEILYVLEKYVSNYKRGTPY